MLFFNHKIINVKFYVHLFEMLPERYKDTKYRIFRLPLLLNGHFHACFTYTLK